MDGAERVVYGIIARAYWDSRGKPLGGRDILDSERVDAVLFFKDGRFAHWCSSLGIDTEMMLLEIERVGGGKIGDPL